LNGDTIGVLAPPANPARDVFHTNAVRYNPGLDQIILSVPTFNEVWVIDHSTTEQEAAGSTGGRSGRGGDLLYRWGNPQVYGRGTPDDRLLGFQHDARWVPQGRPGAGHMMAFSTTTPGPNGDYTKVYEFVPPVDAEGRYAVPDSGPFGPAGPVWTYSKPDSFDATHLSGAERMENGNTLISSGPQGRLFEVTSAGEIVWEYWSPYGANNGGESFALFRAAKIGQDHPALAGRDLRPLDPQPPVSPLAFVIPGDVGANGCPIPPPFIPPAPTVTSILPSSGAQGTSVNVALTGTHFNGPSVVISGEGITVSDVTAAALESLAAKFTIAPGAPPGGRDVTVTTAGGISSPVLFTVLPPKPTLTRIEPGMGVRGLGAPLNVTLNGTDFSTGLTLNAGAGINVSDISVISSTEVTARLSVGADAAPGPRDVSVTTLGGTSAKVTFIVADPFPDLSIVSTHTGNFGAGFDERYTVTVMNEGATRTTGAIVVTDALPAGLTFVSSTGPGWSCFAPARIVTCTNSAVLAANESTSFTLTVAVGGGAPSRLNHAVSVNVDGDLNAVNDSASDVTTVVTPQPALVFTPSPLLAGKQATVAVTMATPFPHDVTGSVTLSFDSEAPVPLDDPAIQLASGGRAVTFMIPANGTQARFGSAPDPGPLAFQTGTVAGKLKFRGSFTAGAIGGDFPPSADDDGALMIPFQAPTIQSIETSAQGGLAVSILLFSTTREVTQLSLSFDTSPKVRLSCGALAGCSASGNILTLDVAPLFTQWFKSNTTLGGLALLRLPLRIEGGTVRGVVTVTLSNNQGVSNSLSFVLP
jgi:hypothetical protein